jgi:hypothetical protein
MTSVPGPSDAALEHLASLLAYRPDEEVLVVEIYPSRCGLCNELATWVEGLRAVGARVSP